MYSGPVSTLPGYVRQCTDPSEMCHTEGHENVPAIATIQGETDSMGAEYIGACRECLEKHQANGSSGGRLGFCNCGRNEILLPFRDPDEGMSGPVYYKCSPCRAEFFRAYREYHDE